MSSSIASTLLRRTLRRPLPSPLLIRLPHPMFYSSLASSSLTRTLQALSPFLDTLPLSRRLRLQALSPFLDTLPLSRRLRLASSKVQVADDKLTQVIDSAKEEQTLYNSPSTICKRFCTLETESNDVPIPPELLSGKPISAPDRPLGQYADLVARVTNFHSEDKGLMVLAGDVFDVPIRKDIVHRVVLWQLAKRRQGTHSTKTISEVSGTGRKPYKQKGTGRARHGTLRGPQFRHGATMHGPKPRSHEFKMNKKVRRLGLKVALSARTAEGKLMVFEDFAVPNHKTKNIVSFASQMEDADQKKKKLLLVGGDSIDENLKLATRNLHYVNVMPAIGLNVYSILQHDTLVMTRDAVNRIVERMHTPINR